MSHLIKHFIDRSQLNSAEKISALNDCNINAFYQCCVPCQTVLRLSASVLLDTQPTKAEGLIQNATSYDTIDASEA